ncbi:MAG TPA: hypothetical protein VNZ64_04875 [Candidatus Acidoferrum sp.]|jgi:hypothetical protein|nr:hypothetical protein [Candidatus Acidoferrum sp.]
MIKENPTKGLNITREEHEIDLSAALDVSVPLAKEPAGKNNGRGQVKKHPASRNGPLL